MGDSQTPQTPECTHQEFRQHVAGMDLNKCWRERGHLSLPQSKQIAAAALQFHDRNPVGAEHPRANDNTDRRQRNRDCSSGVRDSHFRFHFSC